jgi:hypothetical protein
MQFLLTAYFANALQAYVAVAVQVEALWDAAEAANLGAHALAAVQFLMLPQNILRVADGWQSLTPGSSVAVGVVLAVAPGVALVFASGVACCSHSAVVAAIAVAPPICCKGTIRCVKGVAAKEWVLLHAACFFARGWLLTLASNACGVLVC